MSGMLHRLAALGLLAVVLVTGWSVIAAPLIESLQETEQALLREHRLKARLETRIAQLQTDLAQLDGQSVEAIGWQGSRTGEISARIQSQIGERARAHGLQLRSVAAIEADDVAGSAATGFRVELQAPMDQAARFLRDLEIATPPILARRTNIRRLNRGRGQSPQPVVFMRLELAAPIIVSAAGDARQ